MEMGLILSVGKVQELFWVAVEIIWESGFLLGIGADVLYASPVILFVRLFLAFFDIVYWC